MILAHLERELVVQVNDKTRLDASKCDVTPDTNQILKIEIKPESTASFIDVSSDKFLDWSYSTSGTKTVTLRITTGTTSPLVYDPHVDFTYTLSVVTAAQDALFSNDNDLLAYEDDILKYVRNGRNTFLDKHRAAQKEILQTLDRKRIVNTDGTKITKDQILDIDEVREWSKFKTLQIIFQGISNATGDVFSEKAKYYESKAKEAENFALIRLDLNKDGEIDDNERLDIFSTGLIRR